MNRVGFIASSLLVALALLSSMMFVVDQRQFGVVYALGQIKDVITEPGLNFKLPPPFQNVSYIDKRLLTLDSADAEPMLTLEKQRMVIDWYVRWRITDPQATSATWVWTKPPAPTSSIGWSAMHSRKKSTNARSRTCCRTKREALMAAVKKEVLEVVKGSNPWGVDVVDVRITRADYVDAITESVYRRMEAERKRVANELRSTGAAEGEKIRADADRQREVTIANAYREAQKIKGDGDAEAARIYSRRLRPRPAVCPVLSQPGCLQGQLREEERCHGPGSVFRVLQGHAWIRRDGARCPCGQEVNLGFRHLLAALALVLVIEGLLPFLSPGGWRRLFAQLLQLQDGQVRFFGLCSMCLPDWFCCGLRPSWRFRAGKINVLTALLITCPPGSCRITLPMSCHPRRATSKNFAEACWTQPAAMGMNWSCRRCWSIWSRC
jgi:membrane protease subunit HflC